ncbi:MAG: hypothetical protein EZS28_013697 [Streblomastix strix]|uniref:Uncharacterized protein n=1 Tax=Streblomastix strix TaxID=222440 RepID=A0A5J4W7C1_9EUKA|nr:MAG: hypothetical protein EZS28_013697 [Streblomastix strix]
MIDMKRKQVCSFRHSVAAQLVVMVLDETILNTYTGHAMNSISTNEYYVLVERLKDNEIATNLFDIDCHAESNPISSFANLLLYPNIVEQVGELMIMVSNKLVVMRCKQSFKGGYAHAVN